MHTTNTNDILLPTKLKSSHGDQYDQLTNANPQYWLNPEVYNGDMECLGSGLFPVKGTLKECALYHYKVVYPLDQTPGETLFEVMEKNKEAVLRLQLKTDDPCTQYMKSQYGEIPEKTYRIRKITCKAFQRAIDQYVVSLESKFKEFDINDDDSTGSSTYEDPSVPEIVATILYDDKTVFSTLEISDKYNRQITE